MHVTGTVFSATVAIPLVLRRHALCLPNGPAVCRHDLEKGKVKKKLAYPRSPSARPAIAHLYDGCVLCDVLFCCVHLAHQWHLPSLPWRRHYAAHSEKKFLLPRWFIICCGTAVVHLPSVARRIRVFRTIKAFRPCLAPKIIKPHPAWPSVQARFDGRLRGSGIKMTTPAGFVHNFDARAMHGSPHKKVAVVRNVH